MCRFDPYSCNSSLNPTAGTTEVCKHPLKVPIYSRACFPVDRVFVELFAIEKLVHRPQLSWQFPTKFLCRLSTNGIARKSINTTGSRGCGRRGVTGCEHWNTHTSRYAPRRVTSSRCHLYDGWILCRIGDLTSLMSDWYVVPGIPKSSRMPHQNEI